MYLIDKEDLSLRQTREKGDDVRLFLDRRTTRTLESASHLMCDDHRYCRLPQSWRTIEEDMFEGFSSDLRRIDRDLEVSLHLILSDIL